jgi:hypothetical protein
MASAQQCSNAARQGSQACEYP